MIAARLNVCCCSAALSLGPYCYCPYYCCHVTGNLLLLLLHCYWLSTGQGYENYDKSKLESTTEEDVQTKVRLTALMTLGTRSTHELKFAEVQQALGLGSDSEVEAWVVRAIGKVGPLLGWAGLSTSGVVFQLSGFDATAESRKGVL